MADGDIDKITNLPKDEALAHVLASEMVVTMLASRMEVTPLRMAALLLVAYRQGETSNLREAFEEGADEALTLARMHRDEQLG